MILLTESNLAVMSIIVVNILIIVAQHMGHSVFQLIIKRNK